MRSAVIGFVVGIAWLQTQAVLPSYSILLLLMLPLALAAGALCRLRDRVARMILLTASGVLAGSLWAALVAHHVLSEELPAAWEGRDVTVIGTIDSLPDAFERGVRFRFHVERALPVDGVRPPVPSRLALSWYTAFDDGAAHAVGNVQPGERWRLTVRLRRPHGNANPYGFDYEAWLLQQGIRATGYVRPDKGEAGSNARLDAFVFSPGNTIARIRGWLRTRIETALRDQPYAGVIVALVIGDQRAISQTQWTVFNQTSTSHLIAISGLHITMIAALFAGLTHLLWRKSFFTRARLPLILPAQKAAAIAGVAVALVYVLLAGAGVPAQRTLYMLTVVAIALWCGRLTNVSHVLCLALFAVMLLDPLAVLGPGFWLSFAAVSLILYVSVGRAWMPPDAQAPRTARWREALRTAATAQYAITIGLVPLTVLLFGQASLVSPIANAVAIPLIGFVVTPAALLGSVLPAPLSDGLLLSAHWLVAQLAHFLAWLCNFPMAVWSAPIPEGWMFALAAVGTVWMLAPRGWPTRYLGAFAWLPLVLHAPAHPAGDEMWVTAFDVGQGMALLVETPHHRLLYDTGPAYSPEADGGNRVILPYLRARGINALDGVIVSHSDSDHSGGALSILTQIRTDWLSSSLPFDHPIVAAAGASHRRCLAGQHWEWDGAQFDMLHPGAASYDSSKWKPNARSCTLKITLGRHAILLPGDIEALQEDELLSADAERLHADVLLAPHHGSGTSSTLPFLRAVDPRLALFQVGYRNRYRHPKQEVYARYGTLGITRLRTDVSGAVMLRFGPRIDAAEYRSQHARYWYGR
ncbi:MAG TPA: DNA internalization-related competence protein ComEC/Rec2 [Oxalicibacterium sp.]|nr:DNA internalization-related competence protein ComEC/Rec2 [Oxalicibacterium sp.]